MNASAQHNTQDGHVCDASCAIKMLVMLDSKDVSEDMDKKINDIVNRHDFDLQDRNLQAYIKSKRIECDQADMLVTIVLLSAVSESLIVENKKLAGLLEELSEKELNK